MERNNFMKSLVVTILFGLWVFQPQAAFAENGGRGDDECLQSLYENDNAIVVELTRQIDALKVYSNVDWASYNWFAQRTRFEIVPKLELTPTCPEGSDACTSRKTRTTKFSRTTFCKFSDLKKQKIIFHEHLVMAEIEDTWDFHISGEYIPNRNKSHWSCSGTGFFLVPGQTDIIYSDDGLPLRAYGSTPDEAWRKLNAHYSAGGALFCSRVGRPPHDSSFYADGRIGQCFEVSTPASACVQQF
jgi:hypothetical protein